MTTTTKPPANTEVEPADTDTVTDPPGDSTTDPADTDPTAVEAPGDADASMPEDDSPDVDGEDSPTGFPGGAVLASAADVVAVGGGALVAGAGGAGVMLLAAGGLAAAGAAAAARRTNERRRREAGRRVAGTARASRRSTGGTPGLTRGRSTSRRGGGVGFGRDGASKTRRRRGADPGHGGAGKSGRRRRPGFGRDGTGKSGQGLFGRGFGRSSPFRRSSSAKSRKTDSNGTGGSKGRSWWGKRAGRNPTTSNSGTRNSNSGRRRGALARGRAWLPKLPALGKQPWNRGGKPGSGGKRPPSMAGRSWWRGLVAGLRVPVATAPPGARTPPAPAPGSGVAALPRGRHAPRPAAASAVSAEDAVRQALQIRKALAGVKDAVKAIEAAAASAAGARGEDEGPGPTGPQPLGGQGMGQFPLPAAAAEFRSAASQYTPDDMYEFGLHLAQMPAAMADIAEGLKTMAIRTGTERPVNRLVVEALAALYHAQRATITAAEEIAPMFRKAHATDLARREAPRTNEQEWNVQ